MGKPGTLIELQDLNAVLDSPGRCKFIAGALDEDFFSELLSAHWGVAVEPAELRLAGERIWNAERLFNVAAGSVRADDTLPWRLRREPVASGPAAGHVVDLEPMLDEYYDCRGWDAQGRPSPGKLSELGPEWALPP